MFGEIGEILHALLRHVGRHRQRELGALEILRQDLGSFRRVEVIYEGFLRRHPVPEENVDFAVLHRLISDGHGKRLDVGFITQCIEQCRGDAIGCGNIRPAGIA